MTTTHPQVRGYGPISSLKTLMLLQSLSLVHSAMNGTSDPLAGTVLRCFSRLGKGTLLVSASADHGVDLSTLHQLDDTFPRARSRTKWRRVLMCRLAESAPD